jgi:hypothetical protein
VKKLFLKLLDEKNDKVENEDLKREENIRTHNNNQHDLIDHNQDDVKFCLFIYFCFST